MTVASHAPAIASALLALAGVFALGGLVGCDGSLELGARRLPAIDGGTPPVSFPTSTVPSDAGSSAATWEWLNPRGSGNYLRAVGGSAPNDVWAVGAHGTVLHWDGAHVSAPYTGDPNDTFYTVSSSGPNDVWIGGQGLGGASRVVHFDGHVWSTSYSLESYPIHAIWGATAQRMYALTESDVWHSPIQRWDGAQWVNAIKPAVGAPRLRDLWGPKDGSVVWAVGSRGTIIRFTPMAGESALTQEVAASPSALVNPFAQENDYIGIWGSAASDVWAMYFAPANGFGFSHWDGVAWTVVSTLPAPCPVSLPEGPLGRGRLMAGASANMVLASLYGIGTDEPANTGCAYGVETMAWNGAAWGNADRGLRDNATPGADRKAVPRQLNLWSDGSDRADGLYAATTLGLQRWSALSNGDADPLRLKRNPWKSVLDNGMRASLRSVAPVSRDEAWAIATSQRDLYYEKSASQLVRWTTDAWTPVSAPLTLSRALFYPEVLAATSPSDVWAGGYVRPSSSDQQGALSHFDGSSWSPPTIIPGTFEVVSVWARSSDDAWAIGRVGREDSKGPYIGLRWNGVTWSTVTLPSWATDTHALTLFGTAKDVWLAMSTRSGPSPARILRWDGAAFVELPAGRPDPWFFSGRGWASGPSDVWLAGAPVERFNGSSWAPLAGTDYATRDIAGTGPDNVWLTGDDSGSYWGSTLRHWNGGRLTTVLTVSPPNLSLAVSPNGDSIWSVGDNGATLRLGTSHVIP